MSRDNTEAEVAALMEKVEDYVSICKKLFKDSKVSQSLNKYV